MKEAEFLDQYSLEITAKDVPALEAASVNIPAGSAISVTYLHHENEDRRVAAAVAARRLRFNPVPHLAARRLRSADELRTLLARLAAEAGVDRVFVIAGDVDSVDGPYADSLAVIRSSLLEASGIRAVGIGGYPEGHPKISQDLLWQALRSKTQALRERGLDCEIVTQFGFDPDALIAWLARLRQEGIEAPVRVGLPGPANITTLLRFAAVCGVATSARVLAKYGLSMSRLIGSAGPDRFVGSLLEQLSPALHGDVRVHLYPFGGLGRAADWARTFGGAAQARKCS